MQSVKDQKAVVRDQSLRATERQRSELQGYRTREKNYRAAGLQNDGNSGDATD